MTHPFGKNVTRTHKTQDTRHTLLHSSSLSSEIMTMWPLSVAPILLLAIALGKPSGTAAVLTLDTLVDARSKLDTVPKEVRTPARIQSAHSMNPSQSKKFSRQPVCVNSPNTLHVGCRLNPPPSPGTTLPQGPDKPPNQYRIGGLGAVAKTLINWQATLHHALSHTVHEQRTRM
jgi:hypothetical protein